jgi:DNA-directed RNA polymerase subunit beta
VDLKNGRRSDKRIDDIDHLGNRRVRVVGELLENQYRIGLVRMERAIKERMSLQEIETLMPHDLINSKPVSAVIKEFFGSSQLSQFMDQTNPLSAVTHKRRLSALGPGRPDPRARRLRGARRAPHALRPDLPDRDAGRPEHRPDRLALDLRARERLRLHRDAVPRGPRRQGVDEVKYLSALEEERLAIAQANARSTTRAASSTSTVQARGRRVPDDAAGRGRHDGRVAEPAGLGGGVADPLPRARRRQPRADGLEHAAAGGAAAATEAPLVGTGMEAVVARDSGVTVVAKRDGTVVSADASRIVIKPDEDDGTGSNVDIINLIKYQRSNQNTCINQKPIVKPGRPRAARAGDRRRPGTERGELALGRNVVVAFMPWGGYNFEDSILISERVVKDDSFTSVHIEEFECVARDTKLGKEEITRDIPNVGEEALKDLDESGIVRIGAEVKPDDILVGKITPKGETQLSPEERLLRAIFGEKAGDVRDTSLRVPPGVSGIVIGAQVFSRRGVEKDERARAIEEQEIERLRKDQEDEIRIIRESALTQGARAADGQARREPRRATIARRCGSIRATP